jgi:hypothetical protein
VINLTWSIELGDVVPWLNSQADDSIDLLCCSPPYELARTYGIGERMVGGQAWVDWMVGVVRAASPKVKGLIAIVCEGQTRQFAYTATPFLLAADLHRAGFNLRKPPAFHRIGIPGSGGPDWLRNDWEPIICVTRPGKLPWSDNTACGHPPKWAPGGAMSHRMSSGTRVNQWGKCGTEAGANGSAQRTRDGGRHKAKRPSHVMTTIAVPVEDSPSLFEADRHDVVTVVGQASRGGTNGDTKTAKAYAPPVKANPGNVIHIKVGGGLMGHELAHENEAPYPLALAEFFVKSFCPPGGVVCDPFSGSGTTAHAAILHGRRFVGCDVRESQVELTKRRLATVTPSMFTEAV